MILMLAPGPNMMFGAMPSGAAYRSDQFALIRIDNDSTADQTALQQAGCYTLTPFGGWGGAVFEELADLYAADNATGLIVAGQTGYPRYMAATVSDDGGNSGTWAKTGTGNGSGNWTQVSTGTFYSVDDAVAEAVAARDAAIAGSAIAAVLTDGFPKGPLQETYTHGNARITGSSGPVTPGLVWLNDPVPHSGYLKTVLYWTMQSAASEVQFHRQGPDGKRYFVTKATVDAVSGADRSYDVSGQNVYVERGLYVAWKAGARLAVTSDDEAFYSPVSPEDGTAIDPIYSTYHPSLAIEIERDTNESEGAVWDAVSTSYLGQTAGVYFLSAQNTARIRAAYAAVRSGEALPFTDAMVLGIGDSNTAGTFTGIGDSHDDEFHRCYLSILAEILPPSYRKAGISLPCTYGDSFMGTGNKPDYEQYNHNCLGLGGWFATGSDIQYLSVGAGMFSSTVVGSIMEFALADGLGTADLAYPVLPGVLGVFAWSTDGGGTWNDVDQATGPTRYAELSVDLPAGTDRTIQFKHVSGARVALHRMFAYDETRPAIHFVNAGNAGSLLSTTWMGIGADWSTLRLCRSQPAALKLINLGGNDIASLIAHVEPEYFLSAMRRFIYACRALSDVIVLGPLPLQITADPDFSEERQLAFRAGLFALCRELNVPFVDLYGLMGSWDEAALDGLTASDGAHYLYPGHQSIANFLFDVFARF